MRVIPHTNNRLENDDVIQASDLDGSVAPRKFILRSAAAQERDGRRTSFLPDDSWIDVKREVENESNVRVIPHEVAEKTRRPIRKHEGQKDCHHCQGTEQRQ